MDSKKLTICCVAIILVVAVIGAAVVLTHVEGTEIRVLSSSGIYEHENVTVQLTTADGDPIANQSINITLINSEGKADDYDVVTDSEGKASCEINKSAGNYTLECVFEGNDGYGKSNTTSSLEIKQKEKPKETQVSSSGSNGYGDYVGEDEFTGKYDEFGNPIYRTVSSTSKYGGQMMYPGIYETYWSKGGPRGTNKIG